MNPRAGIQVIFLFRRAFSKVFSIEHLDMPQCGIYFIEAKFILALSITWWFLSSTELPLLPLVSPTRGFLIASRLFIHAM
jgi:hypothetical protein